MRVRFPVSQPTARRLAPRPLNRPRPVAPRTEQSRHPPGHHRRRPGAAPQSNGPGNFTVEDIADAAGISRRTFFNYFGSTEAAIAVVTFGFLDKALQQFRLRPAGEPFLESARAALVELADPMTVAPMAELYSLGQANPQLSRSELEAWDHCTAQIIAAARERFAAGPPASRLDELYLRALAGSVISCGKAAMDVWFARCGAIPHAGIPVHPAPAPDRFHEPAGLRVRPP